MGTIANKLAKLNSTKAALKAALAEKGQTVGDVFSTYPAAVRAIETGGVLFTIKNTYEAAKPPESAKGGEYVVFSAGSASIKILSDSGNRIPILSSGSFGKKTISFVMPNENIVVSQDV